MTSRGTSGRGDAAALGALLVMASLAAGLFLVYVTTPIGSGDYGQWLMTSRQFLGEEVPDYRSLDAVPPLMPMLLGGLRLLIADPVAAVHAFGGLVLVGLAISLYLAGSALHRGRSAGLLAVVGGLLLVEPLLELFAFGGLLQAAALSFGTLGVAAVAGGVASGRKAAWWLASACLVLAILSHLATGMLALAGGTAVAAVGSLGASGGWRERLRQLASIGAAWLIGLLVWFTALLHGSGAYVANPASLNYRGPDRLLESLFGHPPTAAVVILGAGVIVIGVISEVRRRSPGRWAMIGAWAASVAAFLLASVASAAATDYPRFTTPLLAPLVVATAGGAAVAGTWLAEVLRPRPLRPPLTWGLVAVAALAVVGAPVAADRFRQEARGYQLADAGSLVAVADFVSEAIPSGATVLAPVREGKWLEGLTGRPSLFSNPVRYSFRADEWQRALAAATLLQSRGAVVNEFFFLKFADADPCAGGSPPTGFTMAMNHGGEYVDALRITTSSARILGPGGETLATVANLDPGSVTTQADESAVRIRSEWSGERGGAAVSFRQAVRLTSNGATLDLLSQVETGAQVSGIALDLQPGGGAAITAIDIRGQEAQLVFTRAGRTVPRLRVVVAGTGATLERSPQGGLRVTGPSATLRVLVTDLTASGRASSGLRLLCPQTVRDDYDVAAVVLTQDASFDARRGRVESLGFHVARIIGPYAVLLREGAAPAAGATP